MSTPDIETEIYAILRQHVGRENAITAPEIAALLGREYNYSREIRRIISAAQLDETFLHLEMLVCAVPGHGYFCASSYDEACAYHTILSTLSAEAQRKLTSFADAAKRIGLHLTSDL